MRRSIIAAAIAAFVGIGVSTSAFASSESVELPDQDWQHAGMFGTFDRGALQRGFQVFQEVCAACHSLDYIAFRNLTEIGFSEDDVKAIAAQYEVEDGPNNEGDMFDRTARPSDKFPAPFANPQAARASNGGALPPDLSLVIKAREGGADYIYALLTGYEEEAPEGVSLAEGMTYNHFFPGRQIAMPPPLYEGVVEYADGTEATLERVARDITVFLSWTAEPELEERKETGLKVLIFIGVLTALLFVIYKRTWARLKTKAS